MARRSSTSSHAATSTASAASSRSAWRVALEQWCRQAELPESERVPIHEGRRNEPIRTAIGPLRGELPQKDVDRIAHALGLVISSEAVIALCDAVGLDVPAAKKALLDAGRWLLSGALAELTDPTEIAQSRNS